MMNPLLERPAPKPATATGWLRWGGVDMDKLAQMDEASLREYIRGILEQCMPGGRFALGSGNTVANYVPLSNYFIMLEESRRWQLSLEKA